MKPGGEFSHWKAIKRSVGETLADIGNIGGKVTFHAKALGKSFIKEPLETMSNGMVDYVSEVAGKTDALMRKTKIENPVSRLSVFGYYLAKDAIVGGGTNLGEGYAKAITAKTSDQLVEGLSQFYGGVAGGAGLVSGGMAGAGVRFGALSQTISGMGAGNLAVATVSVGAPGATAAAGAVAGGGMVYAMVGEAENGGGSPRPPQKKVQDFSNNELVDAAHDTIIDRFRMGAGMRRSQNLPPPRDLIRELDARANRLPKTKHHEAWSLRRAAADLEVLEASSNVAEVVGQLTDDSLIKVGSYISRTSELRGEIASALRERAALRAANNDFATYPQMRRLAHGLDGLDPGVYLLDAPFEALNQGGTQGLRALTVEECRYFLWRHQNATTGVRLSPDLAGRMRQAVAEASHIPDPEFRIYHGLGDD